MIEMIFDDQIWSVHHCLVNGCTFPRVVGGAEGHHASRQTTQKIMFLEESNQFICILNESQLDMVAAPHWVMAVEIS